MSNRAIKPEDFLNMDMSEVIDWLQENAWGFALIPREPTKEMASAFNRSINAHGASADDALDAMISSWETSNDKQNS